MEFLQRLIKSPAFWLVALVSIPFAIGAVQLLAEANKEFYLEGDQALIDIAVRRTVHLMQITGPYSRFDWSHPGPIYFLLIAPGVYLFGNGAGIYFGAILLNWFFAAMAIVLLVRRTRLLTAAGVAIVFIGYTIALGPRSIRDPWNPQIVVMALFASMIAVVVKPSLKSVALAVLGISVALQSHVGTVGIVTGIVFTGVMLHVLAAKVPAFSWMRHGEHTPLLPQLRSTIVITGLALLLWVFPIADVIINGRYSNVGTLVDFNLNNQEDVHHTLADGFLALLGGSWFPILPVQLPPPRFPGPVWIWIAAWVAFGLLGCVLAYRRKLRVPFGLLMLSVISMLTAGFALSRVSGDIFVYLLWWVALPAVMFLAGWFALLVDDRGLLARWPKLLRYLMIWALALASFFSVGTTLGNKAVTRYSREDVRAGAELILDDLGTSKGVVVLHLPDTQVSSISYGIIDQLIREGFPVRTLDPQRRSVETRGSDGREIAAYVIAAIDSGNDAGGRRLGVTQNTGESISVRRLQ